VGTDQELVEQIRAVLGASTWIGEGYRKVWARLRHRGVRTASRRVLRLMREQGLLAPREAGRYRFFWFSVVLLILANAALFGALVRWRGATALGALEACMIGTCCMVLLDGYEHWQEARRRWIRRQS
jgi:hypothetical protein